MSEDLVVIQINPKKDVLHIHWEAQIYSTADDGKASKKSYYIPGFEFYFSAGNDERATQKAKALTNFFFDHYLADAKNKTIGYKRLILDLNKKGFRDKKHHSEVMFNSLRGKPVKTTMSSGSEIPEGYETSTSVKSELVA